MSVDRRARNTDCRRLTASPLRSTCWLDNAFWLHDMMKADESIEWGTFTMGRRKHFANYRAALLLLIAVASTIQHDARAASPIVTFSQISSDGFASTDTNSCAIG